MVNTDWMNEAACTATDPETFFPSSTGVPGQREAEAAVMICRSCPVVFQCREYGKRFSRGFGIWGGVSRAARPNRDIPHEIDHGTERGQRMHLRRGETPCRPCREAATLANSMRKEKKRNTA